MIPKLEEMHRAQASSRCLTSADLARISHRRHAAYLILSMLGVYLSHLISQECHSTILILGIAPSCGSMVWIASRFGPPSVSAWQPCCVATSLLLLSLQKVTKFIEKCYTVEYASGFSKRQHFAVHFALTFFVLSELEFYRQYIVFKGFDNWCISLQGFLRANIDRTFKVSRDPWCYMRDLPRSWTRYLDGETEPEGFLAILFSKSHNAFCLMIILFYIIGGCFNYTIKRLVNPSPDTESFFKLAVNCEVFFDMKNSIWKVNLGVALLRVVRQADFMAFWVAVRGGESVLKWWKARAEAYRMTQE